MRSSKKLVRSSLAQAAQTMDEADFTRAVLAEATMKDFSMTNWLAAVSKWRQVSVLDSRTGYDLLNGTNVGEDKRLAIDITCMKQSLQEDGAARLVRWVCSDELISDDLTKLVGNSKLMEVMATGRG